MDETDSQAAAEMCAIIQEALEKHESITTVRDVSAADPDSGFTFRAFTKNGYCHYITVFSEFVTDSQPFKEADGA